MLRKKTKVKYALRQGHFSIMFTILPSLYMLGVHYFQQWKAPYYYEQLEKQESITKICPTENKKVKTRRKRTNVLRRKTSISELKHDDIVHLINKTGFTREEVVGRYDDFLVCII